MFTLLMKQFHSYGITPVNKFGAVFEWHFWAHEICDILQQTLNPWIIVIVHTPQKVTLPNLQNKKKNTRWKVIDRCSNMWHHIMTQCKTKDTFIKYQRCQQGVPGFTLSRSVCVYIDFVYEKINSGLKVFLVPLYPWL